ncbi:MAG: hypothetical protein PHQ80_03700 [Candidatus ainarchaeum sp.]|nr:hypothetical protein [Candidatus ainarchaeum sp.]
MPEDFSRFSAKVLAAVKGKLSRKEAGTLSRLLNRTKKRNVVLAAGLLSALKVGGASKAEIDRFAGVLEKAHVRILEGKEPFTKADEGILERIFNDAKMPLSAEKKLKHNVQGDRDDLLAGEIVNSIIMSTSQRLKGFVPEKRVPVVRFEEEEEEKVRKRAKG